MHERRIDKCTKLFLGGVTGKIYGSPNFNEGERIETSPIETGEFVNGGVVTTNSGSRYFLSNDNSLKQRSQKAAVTNISESKPRATINLTRLKREKEAKAAEEILAKAKPRRTISLFGITLGDDDNAAAVPVPSPSATKTIRKAPRGVPTINRWKQNRDGSVTGFITGSPNFSENEKVTTSPITSGAVTAGSIVRTGSGSKYFLG